MADASRGVKWPADAGVVKPKRVALAQYGVSLETVAGRSDHGDRRATGGLYLPR